jgi:FkbM family methyltransferase
LTNNIRHKVIAVSALAHLTRRVHPRGTDRVLRALHPPDHRSWSVQTIAPVQDNMRLNVNTSSFLEWRAFFYGSYEPEVSTVLRRFIRPGSTAIDAGANIGVHTLTMARAAQFGPVSGRVIACEPSPAICARLRANLLLNRVTNCDVRQVALLERIETVTLYTPNPATQSNQATASLQRNEHHLSDGDTLKVLGTTLDALVADERLPVVDLVKIDVEGFEGAVLAGARGLLERDHPALVFEYERGYWGQAGYTLDGVLSYLRDLRYDSFFSISGGGLQPVPKSPPAYMNILARRDGLA